MKISMCQEEGKACDSSGIVIYRSYFFTDLVIDKS